MTKDSANDNVFENTGPVNIQQGQITMNMGETLQVKELLNYDDYDERENTENEDIIVCDGRSILKEHNTDHYAEILTVQSRSGKKSPGSKTVPKSPGRKTRTKSADTETRKKSSPRETRNSDNPILCYSSDSESQTKKISRDDSVLYENTGSVSYGRDCVRSLRNGQRLPRPIHASQSDSEIVYQNTSVDDFSDNTSPIYENFEDNMNPRLLRTTDSIRSYTSNEASETESLYEDLDDIYEAMSPPSRTKSVSKPIDIVYTSLDFPRKSASPTSVSPCTYSTSSYGSLDRTELRRCQSYCYGGEPFGLPSGRKPPELPQRGGECLTRRPRPSSMHLGNQNALTDFSNQDASLDNGLGVYTGTLVGSCTVMKTSPKSVQKTIGDILAREKREHLKPVSFDVSTDNLTLGLNCAPWNMLAENSVDDIGCVTTFSSNNKTALGYTISKPGEDTRLFVIHCSDADQIKEAIVNYFKRPVTTNLLSRWASLSVLSTPRSRKTRSLPRLSSLSSSTSKEIATFDELVYLGSCKVKKSFLIVNDSIASVLNHRDSKEYIVAKMELYKDGVHLKNSKEDRLLDIHQLEWILSMGLFDEDRRYFGYISSRAFQGSKTKTSCHVFRCNRVGLASLIMKTLRQACHAKCHSREVDSPSDFRPRTSSSTSNSSDGSMNSNAETASLGSMSSSPPEVDWNQNVTPRMRGPNSLVKRISRNRMTTIQSFSEEDASNDTLGEETARKCTSEEKLHPTKCPANSVTEEVPRQPKCAVEKKTHSEKCTSEESPQPEECAPKESPEKRFSVIYLTSAIVSPPLKSKHVKDCLKQYQKSVDKAMKKSTDNGQHYKKVELVLSPRGVTMLDNQAQIPPAFYERATISGVQRHPDGKCAFAFSTVASANTKHKCHLFLQDKEPIEDVIKQIKSYIS